MNAIKEKNFLRTATLEELKINKLTIISLFCVCVGMDLGFCQGGFEIRAMIEWDKSACDTLRANWHYKPNKPRHNWHQKREPGILESDITKLSTEEILKAADLKVGECGVVIGGFPCQGFSLVGSRKVDDPRNTLYKECVRVVKETLPQMFVFENVPGLVSISKGKILMKICENFAFIGYQVSWDILNAADYGVPQNRKRIFFIGKRCDAMGFDLKTGRTGLYLGAIKGEIKHPDWFKARYKHLFK